MLQNDETIALAIAKALIRATFSPKLGSKKSPEDAVKTYQEVLAEVRKNNIGKD
jgi:hypothetical protein